jgi:hypothetical protein
MIDKLAKKIQAGQDELGAANGKVQGSKEIATGAAIKLGRLIAAMGEMSTAISSAASDLTEGAKHANRAHELNSEATKILGAVGITADNSNTSEIAGHAQQAQDLAKDVAGQGQNGAEMIDNQALLIDNGACYFAASARFVESTRNDADGAVAVLEQALTASKNYLGGI